MNNEIENKMNESDASSDCIENTYAERDNIIRGLLFNRTVNVIAVSGREIVETAREIHGTSRVCTAALGRMLLAVSMMSAIGLIMLVGIVVNNGIILVDYTNLLIDRGMKMKEACLEAGTSRFRPVLMTTLTTILGMIPMCFATSGSAGMVQPIGLAVVGGLTSSTFITLFFGPVLYSLIMKEKQNVKSRIKVDLTQIEN